MRTTIHLHPRPGDFNTVRYEAGQYHPAYCTVELQGDGVDAAIFLDGVAKCDALIKAAVEAKRLLLGDDAPAPPGHAFVRPGQTGPEWPPPDHCVKCGLPEVAHGQLVQTVTTGVVTSLDESLAAAEASPANPYGSAKHGHFDAASAAEVAEGVEESCSHRCGYVSSGQDLLDHEQYEHRPCPECGAGKGQNLMIDSLSHELDCPRLSSPATQAEGSGR